jgi:hypothetical protein
MMVCNKAKVRGTEAGVKFFFSVLLYVHVHR